LRSRAPDARGRYEIDIRALFRTSLRLRPDRIVIGEIRGPEALDLVQAMTSGHGGCLSTIHATSPLDALARLETLALLSGARLPLWALRAQVASAVHAIVQVERDEGGRRSVREVASVQLIDGGHVLSPLYQALPNDGGKHAPTP
jgi:pilus assembly protein CpaF